MTILPRILLLIILSRTWAEVGITTDFAPEQVPSFRARFKLRPKRRLIPAEFCTARVQSVHFTSNHAK